MKFSTSIREKIERKLAVLYKKKEFMLKLDAPVVSFTFDDCPKSAITTGAGILDDVGAKGTFYVCGGLTDQEENRLQCHSKGDLEHLSQAGHEIGSHLFNHKKCQTLSKTELEQELIRNERYIDEFYSPTGKLNFSYPFGSINLAAKEVVAKMCATGRGIHSGLNYQDIDLACLRANALYETQTNKQEIRKLIDEAIEKKAWLIFYTHDVSSAPSPFGVLPETLSEAVEYAALQNCQLLNVRDTVSLTRSEKNGTSKSMNSPQN